MKKNISIALCLWALLFACQKQSAPTEAQAATEAAYGAALLKCVDEANTLAESKACRAKVDKAWGIQQTEKK